MSRPNQITWNELAEALGITPRMLRYRRTDPSAPRTKNLASWLAWRSRKRASTKLWESDPSDDTLHEQYAREQVRRHQLRNVEKSKSHLIEARRIAEMVNAQLIELVRDAALNGTFVDDLLKAAHEYYHKGMNENERLLAIERVCREFLNNLKPPTAKVAT